MPDSTPKLSLRDLAIEVTRRCNMECEHCMRGDIQPIDMNPAYLTEFLSHIDYILDVTLTGGEPSIATDVINEALGSFKTTKTPLGNFYVVTNGKVVPDSFLLAMMQWWLYCDENEISAVALSKDKFHEQVPKENIKKLSSLSFFNEQDKATDWDKIPLLAVGRAKHMPNTRPVSKYDGNIEYEEYDDEVMINNTITLTATGDILTVCDYAYDDYDKYKIANINEPDWFEKFVKHIKPLCSEKR